MKSLASEIEEMQYIYFGVYIILWVYMSIIMLKNLPRLFSVVKFVTSIGQRKPIP